MKIATPRLAPQLEPIDLDTFIDGEVEDASLADVDATNCLATSLDLAGVTFEKVTLTAAQLERITARDIVAKQTDFSAAHMVNGTINRAEFVSCRMSGVDLSRSSLHDVTFRGCKLDMANFRMGDLRRVRFIECSLSEADFLGATLHDVAFEACTLERTSFEQVKAKQLDLRGSELIDIGGWGSLKGAIIDGVQLATLAPYLAQQLGITVRDEQ